MYPPPLTIGRCENFSKAFDGWWSTEVASGKWLEKHNALLEKSKAAAAKSSCMVQ
jgi:hypothetical protein